MRFPWPSILLPSAGTLAAPVFPRLHNLCREGMARLPAAADAGRIRNLQFSFHAQNSTYQRARVIIRCIRTYYLETVLRSLKFVVKLSIVNLVSLLVTVPVMGNRICVVCQLIGRGESLSR